jgi:hypothetical protein
MNNKELISEIEKTIISWWSFDTVSDNKIINSITNESSKVHGNYKILEGIQGNALKFDGFTTYIEYKSSNIPKTFGLSGFTLEAWIALGSYPWNWCPILDQHQYPIKGYYFGIDDDGHVGFYLAFNSPEKQWQGITSVEALELRKWYYIIGVFDPKNGMTIYINGIDAGHIDIEGEFIPGSEIPILIGKHSVEIEPTRSVKELQNLRGHFPIQIFFDGLMDEIKIYNQKFDFGVIKKLFVELDGNNKIKITPLIPLRKLPSDPSKKGEFRAYYTKLEYYEEWDSLWRVGPYTDVIVRFDQTPCKYIFWRGTNYIPCWVTDNDLWFTNEFNETWTNETTGCCEPMSDKQCRHSHVRIIENHDARIVIHWRQALIDVLYKFARISKDTNWGDWSDEIHTIYPDGISVRKVTLYSSLPHAPHEFQESIVVLSPGVRPEDAINWDAVYLMNMKGEIFKYSWVEKAPDYLDKPIGANIEYINLKSTYKPFAIVSDSPISKRRRYPIFRCYNNEINPEVTKFTWWNHWPVSQIPSDGRMATKADKASHSSLSNIVDWASYEESSNSICKIMLHGLTDNKPEKLLTIAKSWLNPPKLNIEDKRLIGEGYDQSERAFILRLDLGSSQSFPLAFSFSILCNEDSPIHNPCFIIKNCAISDLELKINGKKLIKGKDYRFGIRHLVDSSDLVLWIQKEADYKIDIVFKII